MAAQGVGYANKASQLGLIPGKHLASVMVP
jgi:hypothetical protein